MAVLVGIDEAGFGPILGPLVVSSSTFRLPHNLIGADLWQILRKSLAHKRRHLAGRLLITDSKRAYSKSLGIKHLERTILTCLKYLGEEPAKLTELIALLCPDCLERLSDYPWYRQAGSCRITTDQADIELASTVFADDLTTSGITLLGLKSCCLDVAHYNKMVSNVKNKARVLFTATSRLIQGAFNEFGHEELQIIIDRQGGRLHYRATLQRMFADMELKIVSESPAASSYELQADGKTMRLHFVVGADKRFLPVSLSSMVSKYLRELLVANINRYFVGFHSELRPTAGYWKDGLRFIRDLKEKIPHIQYDDKQLVRCR